MFSLKLAISSVLAAAEGASNNASTNDGISAYAVIGLFLLATLIICLTIISAVKKGMNKFSGEIQGYMNTLRAGTDETIRRLIDINNSQVKINETLQNKQNMK
ncbi:MAG: hypothetical protein PHW77_01300 [Eubacteriales bacterium]|nr:hypothetical protein [Eubacteriales bacterium]